MTGRTNSIIGRGGKGGSGFAAICVTYPAGWTCTCTKGDTVLRATDTSGKVVFAVPSAGTWTVGITNGDEGNSTVVGITTANQTQNVTISAPSAPSTGGAVLYNAGTVGEGYTLNRYNVNAGSKALTTAGQNGPAAAFVIKPTSGQIDLSKYSKLNVTFKYTFAYFDASAGLGPVTTSTNLGTFTYKVPNTGYKDSVGIASKMYTLDLSGVTASVDCFKMGGPAQIGIEVTKIEFV